MAPRFLPAHSPYSSPIPAEGVHLDEKVKERAVRIIILRALAAQVAVPEPRDIIGQQATGGQSGNVGLTNKVLLTHAGGCRGGKSDEIYRIKS